MRHPLSWGLALMLAVTAAATWGAPPPLSAPASARRADGHGDGRLHEAFDVALSGGRRVPPTDPRPRELYERYRQYRLALATEFGPAPTLAQGLARRRAIRARYFTRVEREALFGVDDRYDAFTVQRLLLRAERLPDREYQSRLRELEATLPPDLRRARHEPLVPVELMDEEARLRRIGAAADALHALRVQRVGVAAAQRLDELDGRRALWRQRVDAYLARRTQDPARAASWAYAHFDARERVRLATVTSVRRE